MVVHGSLGILRSPMILLSIHTDLIRAVDWMVYIHRPIFNSYSPFSKSMETVPNVPMTIGITVILKFHSFFF